MRVLTLIFLFILSANCMAQDSLKVLSWNVFLRPAILADEQIKRVDSIAEYLNHSNADVLVLQEVFHRRARKKLVEQIEETYPHITRIGPLSFWGISSGVMIASKDTITRTKRINFKRGTGADKLARKGGVAATIKHGNGHVNVIGTHLQAGKGKERESIRLSQMMKLKKLSKSVDTQQDIPLIYAGDFNIQFDSDNFKKLIDSLGVVIEKPSGDVTNTSNFPDDDLYPSSGDPQWIDFILIEDRPNVNIRRCSIEEPKARFVKGKKKERLSDHNPIITTIIIKNDE